MDAWAARLLAADPGGLGGLRIRGAPGPRREALLAQLQALLPLRRCPLTISDERLSGGIDLAASLAAGRPVLQSGLLAEAPALLVPMAERCEAQLAGKLAQAVDAGTALVALDEGLEGEALAAALSERLGLQLDLNLPLDDEALVDRPLAEVQARCAAMPLDAAVVEALTRTAQQLGITSLRAPWQAWCAARAAAAWRGLAQVGAAEAELAARLVLAPRARQLPSSPEAPPAEAPQQEPQTQQDTRPLEDRVAEAAEAAIPPGLLALLAQGLAPRRARAGGRQGTARESSSGRPLPSRRGLRSGQRLDLLATLKAALPWQGLRRQQTPSEAPWLLRRDDLHRRRAQRAASTTTVFLVDASGSQALHRLAEAKGAVELLLADCYVRRDQVALIAFRAQGAELLLPPTRSLVRAKRSLAALPGGGGTPLAAGLEAGAQLAAQLQARAEAGHVQLVLLTDGRANIARDGSPGREQASADALQSARRLALLQLPTLLLDTAPRPQPEARALASALAARYLPLPLGRAEAIHAGLRLLGE